MNFLYDTLRSFSGPCGIAAAVVLCVSCKDKGSTKQAQTPPEIPAQELSEPRRAAIELVASLKLTGSEREKFMAKLVREMGEETGRTFFRAIDSDAFRGDLADLYSRAFSLRELSELMSFAKSSRIVRLSLLTAPHTLSQIPGMGRENRAKQDTEVWWEELKREVEFFDINSLEEFEQESEALRDWDSQSFLGDFEELKAPLIELTNRHLARDVR